MRSRWIPYALLFGCVALFFWRFTFLGRIPIDPAPLRAMRPWSALNPPVEAHDSARMYHNIDPVVEVLPIKTWMAQRLREGDVPLWTPEIFSGAPFAANHHAAPWDASTVLFLVLPPDIAFGAVLLLQLFAAGACMFFYCRVMEYSIRSSLFAATAFLFNSFFFHWLGLISFNAGLIWMPLTAAGIELSIRRDSIRHCWWSALGLGLSFLSGMGQFWLFQVFLFVAYGFFRWMSEDRSARRAAAMTLALALGAGLGATQIVQTLGALPHTSRGYSQAGVYEGRNHLSPRRLPTLLIPDLYGRHEENVFSKLILNSGYPEAKGLAGRLLWGEKGSVFNRAWGYVGIPAFLLMLLGVRTARGPAVFYRWLAAAVLGFQLLLCWDAFHDLCARLWPSFDTLDHTRSIMLYVFAACVLAAEGLERLTARPLRAFAGALAIVTAALIAGGVVLWMAPAVSDIPALIQKIAAPDARYSAEFFQDAGVRLERGFRETAAILFFPTGIFAALYICVRSYTKSAWTGAQLQTALLVISVLDLVVHGWHDPPLLYADRQDLAPPPGAIIEFLRRDPDTFRVYEVHRKRPLPELPLTSYGDLQLVRRGSIRFFDPNSVEFVLRPNVLMNYAVQSAGGYMSLYPGKYRELWTGRGMDVLKALKPGQTLEEWNAPWIGMQNVKYVLAASGLPTGAWKPVFEAEGVQVLKVDSFTPRIYATQAARVIPDRVALLAEIRSARFRPQQQVLLESAPDVSVSADPLQYEIRNVERTPDTLNFSVDMTADGYLVISENFFPGRRAQVDGRDVEILPANLTFQCLPLTKGAHDIRLEFSPPYYTISLLVSVCSALLLLAAAVSLRFHAGNSDHSRPPLL